MTPQEWLDLVRREYLGDFVAGGGAAVKFVVPLGEPARNAVADGLGRLAGELGYLYVALDAAHTKLHQMERLFNAAARQIDWDALTAAYLRRLLPEQGWQLPPEGGATTTADLAARNGYAEPLMRQDLRQLLWKQLASDYAMSQEFRLAMLQLCRAQLDPTDDPGLETAVKEWLVGDLRLIATIKRAGIFQRIGRHNARHMLASLAHWLRLAGKAGLLLQLDVSRIAQWVRPPDRTEGFYYTSAAALDAYEVLRQFIDGTDELEHCFIAVLTGQEFLHDDRRGLRSYMALYMRVADEVRDRYRQNPLGALVRLEVGA